MQQYGTLGGACVYSSPPNGIVIEADVDQSRLRPPTLSAASQLIGAASQLIRGFIGGVHL
jgi:hypothetical protein